MAHQKVCLIRCYQFLVFNKCYTYELRFAYCYTLKIYCRLPGKPESPENPPGPGKQHTEKKDGAKTVPFGNRFEKWCPF